jgi:hypothetical protein
VREVDALDGVMARVAGAFYFSLYDRMLTLVQTRLGYISGC